MQCYTLKNTMRYKIIQCYTIQYNTKKIYCNTMQCYTLKNAVECDTIQHNEIQYNTMIYNKIQKKYNIYCNTMQC